MLTCLHFRGGAPGRTRTTTSVRKPDFESGASTNSATGARSGAARIKPMGGTGSTLASALPVRSYAPRTHPYIPARSNPDKPAYIMAGSGEAVTYRRLDQQSNRIAQLFRSLGLKAGDHIALFLENNPRFFEICWGAQRSGLIYTAISSRLTASAVDYIVGDCGAKLFVTSRYLAGPAAELAPLLKGVAHRHMIDGTIAGYGSWG